MQAPRILRRSLDRIGFTAASRAAAEAPLPLCLILEDEYRGLHPDQALPLEWLLSADHVRDLLGLTRLLLEEAYPDEIAPIHQRRLSAFYRATQRHRPTALCLSGGGIRSATFAFGLLQGLARFRLLKDFDYLSTVSGGGYIGSWLTAWINRDGRDPVLEDLRRSASDCPPEGGTPGQDPVDPEPAPVRQLRAYSNRSEEH